MQWMAVITALVVGLAGGAAITILVARVNWRGVYQTAPWRGGMLDARADQFVSIGAVERVIDSASIGLYFWNMSTNKLFWSKHHYEIFGMPADEPLTYSSFRERIHPDDLPAVDAAIAVARNDGSDYRTRYRLRLSDGSVRYVLGSGRFDFDHAGVPTGMNGAVIDVTATAEAEIGMRNREGELNIIAENLPDIISRFDRNCRFLFISAKVEELTGNPPSFYQGKSHAELGGDAMHALRWRAVLEDVVRNKRQREFDYSFINRYGMERFFITRAFPVFDEDGEVATILAVSTDHTERERSAQSIRMASELLKKADLRKNEYLATLAHELRGPLAPIASATQLIKMSAERQVRERSREVIERQVNNLSRLVNDLMEVSRISAGKMEITKTRLSLETIIDQAAESTRPLMQLKDQPFTAHMPRQPVWLDGDLLRLTQVFVNIITNASKYSAHGSPISVDADVEDSVVRINVRDQGIGLTSSAMEEIFELFVQVNATGVNAQGGLGIGLNLVKQLVELHQGTITVSSDGAGKGSCFSVTLPVAHQAEETASVALQAVSSNPSMRILVVDDNKDGATTLAGLLEVMGHRPLTAFNGRDAVALAEANRLDMAFIDLGLPDISGIQVALIIRGTSSGRRLPLFALTGLGRDEDRYMTTAARFDDHVVKPLQMADLQRILDDVAQRVRFEDEVTALNS